MNKFRARRWSTTPTGASLELIDGLGVRPDLPDLESWHNSYVKNHRVRLATDLDIVREFCDETARILEVGSAPLVLTTALQRRGYDVTGCDLDPSRYSGWINDSGLSVVPLNVETERFPFGDSSFDVVLFNEVFEHLRINPILTLEEVHRVMRPGGLLLMSTPNLRSISGLYNFLVKNECYSSSRGVYEQYSKLRSIGHMGHVREYTTREVSEFLDKIGFRVDCMLFRGSYRQFLPRVITAFFPAWLPYVSFVSAK